MWILHEYLGSHGCKRCALAVQFSPQLHQNKTANERTCGQRLHRPGVLLVQLFMPPANSGPQPPRHGCMSTLANYGFSCLHSTPVFVYGLHRARFASGCQVWDETGKLNGVELRSTGLAVHASVGSACKNTHILFVRSSYRRKSFDEDTWSGADFDKMHDQRDALKHNIINISSCCLHPDIVSSVSSTTNAIAISTRLQRDLESSCSSRRA